jgi:hypothetical protein
MASTTASSLVMDVELRELRGPVALTELIRSYRKNVRDAGLQHLTAHMLEACTPSSLDL